jgi:hypothetical protein
MRTRLSIRRYFAHAISVIMIWVVSVIPSTKVEAQSAWEPHHFWAAPDVTSVGSYVFLSGADLPPNKTYWVSYTHNGYPPPGLCPTETITTDANGEWSRLVGPLAPSEVGKWSVGLQEHSWCGEGLYDFMEYEVRAVPAQLTVDKQNVAPGEYLTYAISGAPPNSEIFWSQWNHGVLTEDHVSYGEYTDGNGNFTKTVGPFVAAWADEYTKRANVYSHQTGDQVFANTAFKVLAQPIFTFTVPQIVPFNGNSTFQITGAPPNKPITWTRWHNGNFWDKYVIGYTDANGNWTATHGPWSEQGWKGLWIYQMTIDDVSVTKEFVVGDLSAPLPPNVVYSSTPLALDPGSGKYFSDVQIQINGGAPDPTEAPMVNTSSRMWFNDSGGAQYYGMEAPMMTLFTGVLESGNMCSQAPQVPPTDPDCYTCGAGVMKACKWKYFGNLLGAGATAAGLAIGCGAFLTGGPPGAIVTLVCEILVYITFVGVTINQIADLKTCVCTAPGVCSDNLQKNCSKMFEGVPRTKKFCKNFIAQ